MWMENVLHVILLRSSRIPRIDLREKGDNMIIAIEGGDGLGKSCQAKLLAEKLKCKYIKFPNEELWSGKRIRQILNKELPFEPASFQALQIINRLETFENLDPADDYVFDRGTLSGIVYGCADGLPDEWVKKVCGFVPEADVTFIFYGTPFCKDADIYSDDDYQQKIRDLYMECGSQINGVVYYIGCQGSVEEINRQLIKCLREMEP